MSEITNPRGLAIGMLSRRAGVNIETIRHYERIGLMPKPARAAGGHRRYADADLRRLRFVRRGRELGFSLDEVRRLLALADGGAATCAEVSDIATVHLDAVRARIADLRRLERVLQDMLAKCSRGAVPECPILDALSERG